MSDYVTTKNRVKKGDNDMKEELKKEYEERALECLSSNIATLTDALYSDSLFDWVNDQLSVDQPDDPKSNGHDILVTYGGPTVYLDTGTGLFHYHENGFDDYTIPIDSDLAEKLEKIIQSERG